MSKMKLSIYISLAVCCVMKPVYADDGNHCAVFMIERGIPQPDKIVSEITGKKIDDLPSLGSCSREQTLMMIANQNAILSAEPTAIADHIYGTWLSDDIYFEQLGVFLSGSEVLKIGDDVNFDYDLNHNLLFRNIIPFEQYWLQSFGKFEEFWDDEGEYSGLVAQGFFPEAVLEGESVLVCSPPPHPLIYKDISFNSKRRDDLILKSRLNFFDEPVSLRIYNDTLVLKTKVNLLSGQYSEVERTYTRVKITSPADALRIIVAMRLSGARYFRCLTHKISTQDRDMIELISPLSLPELLDKVSNIIMLRREVEIMRTAKKDSRGEDSKRTNMLNDISLKISELEDQLKPISNKMASRNDFCIWL
ncbi:hypothetical protein [Palleronia caenipelagi]|uniref:hypothetical protein n=1 Tax=Palleronia caenipelagi TaxID=2489174 RepID=UPI00115F261B|nr:hypothetical protein [Palleronia caenipelagi]